MMLGMYRSVLARTDTPSSCVFARSPDISTVVAGVRKLFADRPDFIERFNEYLPDAGAAASNVSRDNNSGSKPAVGSNQPVTVTNALDYLQLVKSRCPPGDYNVF